MQTSWRNFNVGLMVAIIGLKERAMRVDRQITKMLADSGDLVNTINGGMSLAHVSRFKLSDHYLITVKGPGVDKELLKLEMHDDSLFVFQRIKIDGEIEIPYMVASIELKGNVDKAAITANYHGKNLNIVMPFGEEEDSKEIDIQF